MKDCLLRSTPRLLIPMPCTSFFCASDWTEDVGYQHTVKKRVAFATHDWKLFSLPRSSDLFLIDFVVFSLGFDSGAEIATTLPM